MEIGTQLRAARRQHGLTLSDISRATKIPVSILEAIDRNDVDRLPGGLFNRAFLRAYASEVGLDPEQVVSEYCAERQAEEADAPTEPFDEHTQKIQVTSRKKPARIAFILGVILTLGIYNGFLRTHHGLVAGPQHDSGAIASSLPRVIAPPAFSTSARPGSPSGNTLVLEIRSRGTCTVSGMADGDATFSRLLELGQQITITARTEIVLTVGDGELCSYSINRQSGRQLARRGEPVTVRITTNNYTTFFASASTDDSPSTATSATPEPRDISRSEPQSEGVRATDGVSGGDSEHLGERRLDSPPQVH